MPNILLYQTFYKICCLQHICGNIFVASALKAPSKMPGTSGARSCSSPITGPLPPLLWVSGWNDPLCNFLCSTATSTVTFHPNTFTCRTSVWNRGTCNLPPTTPSSCLPLYITVPVDRSPSLYYVRDRRRK